MMTNGGSFLSLLLSLYILCVVVMAMEELDLMPENAVSSLMEGDVGGFEEKFGFTIDVQLEVPKEDECIAKGIATRVVLHEESLKVRLRTPMLLGMEELLWWYQLCQAQLVPNAWRVIIGFFSLIDWHGMEPKAWVFYAFF